MLIYKTTGMSKYGTTSVRGTGGENNKATSTTPSPTLSIAPLTSNVLLGAVNVLSNPATATQPSGWAEDIDSGYATPATGAEGVHVNSGITAALVTWGAVISTGGYCTIVIELDTSAAAIFPKVPTLVRSQAVMRASVY